MSRSFTWTDDTVEHTDADHERAAALARRWSALHDEIEREQWARQSDLEDGRRYDPEPDYCSVCNGEGEIGIVVPPGEIPGHFRRPEWLVGIDCPAANCEDGRDLTPIIEYEKRERARTADRALELELIEDKLAALGARMMRPYEHWNEDERLVEYLECGRFGDVAW
jgi:hypothetical protein